VINQRKEALGGANITEEMFRCSAGDQAAPKGQVVPPYI